MLAPHPDDFDGVAVTLRHLQDRGHPVFLEVTTNGWRGVEDGFCTPPTPEVKGHLREEEQRESCRLFGLPETQLSFMQMEEDGIGDPLENAANTARMRRAFLTHRPGLVFLPHGNDTNAGHRRIYRMALRLERDVQPGLGHSLALFLNRDPKTIGMRCDVYTPYGEEQAAWKAELLRCHRSQQQRNLNQRGMGFDERILATDRESAAACGLDAPYAEVFELALFGTERPKLDSKQ
jgi:LmbE family N-acetylglucosaminyl deacetylase